MFGQWEKLFEAVYDGRHIEVELYSEGGYKINTTENEDSVAGFDIDDMGMAVYAHGEKGRSITIEGETIAELDAELTQAGFNTESTKAIIDKIRTLSE